MKKNKFKIVIPSYNNSEWVEYNIASILNQSYDNYDVLYINDASTDNTLELVTDIVKDLQNWKVITNEQNMRRGYNISPQNPYLKEFIQDDNDILVFVDGDDWLSSDDVLFNMNEYYNKYEPWMTYGMYIDYPEYTYPRTQNSHYPDFVHQNNLYRKDYWRASHLRTFRWGLYNKIKPESQINSNTGKYYYHAEDLATSFPCLEMCPKDKIGVVNFLTYTFNNSKSNSVRSMERVKQADNENLEDMIRNETPYKVLTSL